MNVKPHVVVMLEQQDQISCDRFKEHWNVTDESEGQQRCNNWSENITMLEESFASCLLPLNAERTTEQVCYDIYKAAETAMGLHVAISE